MSRCLLHRSEATWPDAQVGPFSQTVTQQHFYDSAPTGVRIVTPNDSSVNLLSPPIGGVGARRSLRISPLGELPDRPKTLYDDWEAGQAKLSTASSGAYNIVPDIALLGLMAPEKDDDFHDPGNRAPRIGPDRRIGEPAGAKSTFSLVSARGLLNAAVLVFIVTALVSVFCLWPIINYAVNSTNNRIFTNASGMVPEIEGFRGLVDRDTPEEVLTRTGFDGESYTLVFSDEFNQDGRSFDDGSDPYWTAVSLNYCKCAQFLIAGESRAEQSFSLLS